ncbi:lipid II:glycine glycyltransferase FemX [Azohydromonas caseinilytica]|uniref:Aminoacyltransferase n=1 Tax=Azohydromonas caseinilytica TaxID=2728836 RepID=A0A848FBS2_9BURK|nr:peptidoglycan bridge formation glycyltransferase FemA/FemB family protein [Azohydromonas caseinilytica]NML15640.1 aminoacyltransferase [Azohydromonas caseinilytica]
MDTRVRTPQLLDPERWQAWDRFLQQTPDAGFMQSSWWARFRAPLGFGHFGLTLRDGDAIVGGALVARCQTAPGECFYYVQDGPVLPPDAADAAQVFEAFLQRVERERAADSDIVSHLRIEPRWSALPGFVRGFQPADTDDDLFNEPRRTLCIDLDGDDAALLAQMKPKGRYNIRVAQRHGVAVVEDSSGQGLADFVRIQRRTALRQGIDTKPPGYFKALLAAAPPGQASLHFAEYRGRRIAAALVIRFGLRATYFFGGSLALHRPVMAPYLLHFEIMRSVRAAGCRSYDLWGIAPEDEPEHPWQAISAFKRKLGGHELALVPTLDLVLDAAAYRRYQASQAAQEEADTAAPERSPQPMPAGAPA